MSSALFTSGHRVQRRGEPILKGGAVPGDDLSKGPPYQRGQVDPGLYVGPLRLRPEPGKDTGRGPDPLLRVRPPHR